MRAVASGSTAGACEPCTSRSSSAMYRSERSRPATALEPSTSAARTLATRCSPTALSSGRRLGHPAPSRSPSTSRSRTSPERGAEPPSSSRRGMDHCGSRSGSERCEGPSATGASPPARRARPRGPRRGARRRRHGSAGSPQVSAAATASRTVASRGRVGGRHQLGRLRRRADRAPGGTSACGTVSPAPAARRRAMAAPASASSSVSTSTSRNRAAIRRPDQHRDLVVDDLAQLPARSAPVNPSARADGVHRHDPANRLPGARRRVTRSAASLGGCVGGPCTSISSRLSAPLLLAGRQLQRPPLAVAVPQARPPPARAAGPSVSQ